MFLWGRAELGGLVAGRIVYRLDLVLSAGGGARLIANGPLPEVFIPVHAVKSFLTSGSIS